LGKTLPDLKKEVDRNRQDPFRDDFDPGTVR